MTTGKTIALTRRTFVGKVMSLLFNMLSRLVVTFLPRSKRLLISWLQSPSAVILEPPKIKSAAVSTVSPSICHEVMGPDAMISECWALSQLFHSPLSLSSRGSLGSSSLPDIRVVSSEYLRLLIFLRAILIPACASSWKHKARTKFNIARPFSPLVQDEWTPYIVGQLKGDHDDLSGVNQDLRNTLMGTLVVVVSIELIELSVKRHWQGSIVLEFWRSVMQREGCLKWK